MPEKCGKESGSEAPQNAFEMDFLRALGIQGRNPPQGGASPRTISPFSDYGLGSPTDGEFSPDSYTSFGAAAGGHSRASSFDADDLGALADILSREDSFGLTDAAATAADKMDAEQHSGVTPQQKRKPAFGDDVVPPVSENSVLNPKRGRPGGGGAAVGKNPHVHDGAVLKRNGSPTGDDPSGGKKISQIKHR